MTTPFIPTARANRVFCTVCEQELFSFASVINKHHTSAKHLQYLTAAQKALPSSEPDVDLSNLVVDEETLEEEEEISESLDLAYCFDGSMEMKESMNDNNVLLRFLETESNDFENADLLQHIAANADQCERYYPFASKKDGS